MFEIYESALLTKRGRASWSGRYLFLNDINFVLLSVPAFRGSFSAQSASHPYLSSPGCCVRFLSQIRLHLMGKFPLLSGPQKNQKKKIPFSKVSYLRFFLGSCSLLKSDLLDRELLSIKWC